MSINASACMSQSLFAVTYLSAPRSLGGNGSRHLFTQLLVNLQQPAARWFFDSSYALSGSPDEPLNLEPAGRQYLLLWEDFMPKLKGKRDSARDGESGAFDSEDQLPISSRR